MKKKTVKLVSAVVVLGVVSGAYVGVNSYVSSQEKKESEAETSFTVFFFIMPFSFSAILQSQLPGMQVGSVP